MQNNKTDRLNIRRRFRNLEESLYFASYSNLRSLLWRTQRTSAKFFSNLYLMSVTCIFAGFLSLFCVSENVWGQASQPADVLSDVLNSPELNSGVDLFMSGEYDQCYEMFQKAFETNNQLPPPGILLARLFSDDSKFVLMRQYLEKTVDDYPNDPEAFFQLAGIAIRDQRFVEAALLIEKGKEILSDFQKKRSLSENSKENDSRLKYLLDDILSIQANLAQERGEFEKATEYIRELLSNNPDDDWAQVSLGYLLYEQGRLDESLAAFSKAHELNAEHLPGWLVLALLLEKSEKTAESQKYVDENFNEESATVIQYYNVVQLYLKWGKVEEALAIAEKLKISFANSIETWLLLGQISLYYHEYKVAEDYFKKALLISPYQFEANNGMALALGDQGSRPKLNQAVQIAYANWQRNQRSDEATTTYAWLLYLSGQKDDAELIFSPYLQSGKITPTVAYYLAEIAHAKGDDSLALNFIDLALNQATNFPKKVATRELREIISPTSADSNEDDVVSPKEILDQKTN